MKHLLTKPAAHVIAVCVSAVALIACGAPVVAPVTVPAGSMDAPPDTTPVKDSPLFVSVDYPNPAVVPSTIRFRVECTKPPGDGYSPAVFVDFIDGGVSGFEALSGNLSFVGNGFSVDWEIPATQRLGDYEVKVTCDGATDVPARGFVYPAGVDGGSRPLRLIAPPASTSPAASLPPTL